MEIERYSTHSPLKAVFVERANKTVEDLLYKVMTSQNTAKWIHLLEGVEKHYNNRSSPQLHGLTPNEAHDLKNEEFLRAKYLEDYEKHRKKFINKKAKFSIGDSVRVMKERSIFSRGYEPAFEQEIRVVKDIVHSTPKTYKIEGKRRSYYSQEMVAAEKAIKAEEKQYFIEKTRRINSKKLRSGVSTGGQTEYLLKAKNDPDQSSWISEFEYQKLKDGGLLE